MNGTNDYSLPFGIHELFHNSFVVQYPVMNIRVTQLNMYNNYRHILLVIMKNTFNFQIHTYTVDAYTL